MGESKDAGAEPAGLGARPTLSLQDIDGQDWGEPDPQDSYLVRTCTLLHRRPLGDLGDEDVRLLLGQRIGLPTLAPLALGMLGQDPLASGDLYPGALLASLMGLPDEYWESRSDQRAIARGIAEHVDLEDPALAGTELPGVLENFLVPRWRGLEAELSVSSSDLTLGDLEKRLGRASGPTGYSHGDPSGIRGGPPRVRSCWVERLAINPDRHPGTAGLDEAILELDTGLANRLAQCSQDGCEVVLGIVQRIPVDDQGWARGLHLSAESLAWLARAGAVLDVDQYVV
jgi:hypothetical protein